MHHSHQRHHKIAVIIMLAMTLWGSSLLANQLEDLLFDDTTQKLGAAILDAGRRQAVYSYIIANASTPGVDLEKLLPPDDKRLFKKLLPDGEDSMEILLE